jgi:hypothetical protein
MDLEVLQVAIEYMLTILLLMDLLQQKYRRSEYLQDEEGNPQSITE